MDKQNNNNNNNNNNSGGEDMFSLSCTLDQDSEFEFDFGFTQPNSPSVDHDPNNTSSNNNNSNSNSPADRFFFNGRLLPHVFPINHVNTFNGDDFRISSRTSSASSSSSKDCSLMSSRSNSTNSSRSSSCSSARTSSSDSSERNNYLFYQSKLESQATTTIRRQRRCQTQNRPVLIRKAYHGSSSKKWQFIKPAPALNNLEVSRRNISRKGEVLVKKDDLRFKKDVKKEERVVGVKLGFFRRFFPSFMFACRECHAMEPSSTRGKIEVLKRRSSTDL